MNKEYQFIPCRFVPYTKSKKFSRHVFSDHKRKNFGV